MLAHFSQHAAVSTVVQVSLPLHDSLDYRSKLNKIHCMILYFNMLDHLPQNAAAISTWSVNQPTSARQSRLQV